jgi:myo-inositol 2-dehydrogenase / D-chiro-inositol 1-dehydrogenase
MTTKKLRFAVLGAGRIGKIHAANLAGRVAGAELTALYSASPAPLNALAGRLNVSRTFLDYRRVLELPDVDAVAICTPTDTHYQIILDAAAAGKHIFCEKPVDLSIEKIVRINEEVAKCGVHFMVAFNRRFDPDFLKLREIVKGGKIGEPQILRITSRDPGPPPESFLRSSGGLFLDMTIHDFDMARYLMGSEVTEVYARANVLVDPMFERAGDWDTAVVMLTFENKALGAIDNSRKAAYGYDQRAEVFGSEGMAANLNNKVDNHVYCDREGAHLAQPLNFFMDRYAESYRNEMDAFVEAVLGRSLVPVNGSDGLAAVVIALAAGRSVRENRAVKVSEVYDGKLLR